MYTLYNNFVITGQYFLKKWTHQQHDWAAFSEYRQKANHELYVPQTVLNLVVQGQKRMYDGNQVHSLQAGDVFLIPGDSLICSEILWQKNNFRSINLVLPDDALASYLPLNTHLVLPKKAVVLKADEHWHHFAQSLLRCFTGPDIGLPAREVVLNQALTLIGKQPHGKALLQMLAYNTRQVLPSVVQTLGTAVTAWQELDEIARKTYLSKATLKRRFKTVYHTSPMNWIWQKRLELACFLLRTSGQPIATVAYTAGFENVPHFYRMFKNNYGVTPAQWRMTA
ncbi:AraC family transcriptional regulator [Chitinophaga defluvii]|uniref:AraC family transcriptional regulator n=1 Tax=Chitinophaga defluvii TaxID=3163343 RepID=A0ABV2T9V4_9BACT